MSEHGSPFHQAAREAARRGWAVFPLRVRDKRPMIAQSNENAKDGGFHLATTDAAQIDRWWTKWPLANVGMATGEISGVFVLDLDGPEAEAALNKLQVEHGLLPLTAWQATGKGRHLLFRFAPGVRNRGGSYLVDGERVKCAGFDVRGDGGYIVIPPSIHPNGRAYAWGAPPATAPIVEAPEWLLKAIIPPPPKPAAPMQPYKGEGRATAYGEKALESATQRISRAAQGQRHNTLAGEAAAIGELVAGGEIERAYAERALVAAATAMMAGAITQRELSKITWGLSVGQSNPRRVTRSDGERRATAQARQVHAALPMQEDDPPARLVIIPPSKMATLIVAPTDLAEDAALAWERSNGGPYGLFVTRDLKALAGGLAPNAGGYDDWRLPRADLKRPGATMHWKGRVLVVLPEVLDSFTVSPGTKWEKFISSERHGQVLSLLADHWWRHAGACEVKIAALPVADEAAA